MPTSTRRVFISSTAIDLPAHRQKVVDACQQLHLLADGMEQWPAADASALELCLGKVDAADIFVGIYGHRYGWVPPGQVKSITELEYDRAVERGVPRYLFVMAKDHLLTVDDVETGPGATALAAFKERLGGERVWKEFANADQLHTAVLHALMGQTAPAGASEEVPLFFNDHFPKGAPHFLGRRAELRVLDAAWEEDAIAIVTLIAPGGTGKTSLLLRWLAGMRQEGWRGSQQVFGWSFYSQGTRTSGEASEDGFLAKALECFGIPHDPALHASDKGRLLAETMHRRRCLLLLDGVEPLQYPPGPLAGRLRGPGLEALLHHLALAGQPGLCLITSREPLVDLADHERSRSHAAGNVLRRDLVNLRPADGARLLFQLGAKRAGQGAIAAGDAELKAASREVRGHALTLALLGSYLARAHGGDIRRRHQVRFRQADRDGHACKVMAAYEQWLASGGAESQRELEALRLVGFFDRPATRANLAALMAPPAIPGLTEAVQGMTDPEWQLALASLADCGLVASDADTGTLDAHPLVREYFAVALERDRPGAWQEGHRRLYEQLKASVPHRPDDLVGLQPLYQAVTHGCRAGLYEEALAEVYHDRILRGTGNDGFYSTRKLGAIGADLGAVACFFSEPWQRLAPALGAGARAWLVSW